MSNHHPIIIIGAGLSGLYLAWRLQQQQREVILLEARERIGGRIASALINPPINDTTDNKIGLEVKALR